MLSLRILIADDHPTVRIGMRMLAEDALGHCQVFFAAEGKQIFNLLGKERFDLMLTDLNMPGVDALHLVPKALELQPHLKIMVMSVNPETVFARMMLAAGAYCYLQKDAPDEDISKAIKQLALGKRYLPLTQVDKINDMVRLDSPTESPFVRLSTREMEVTMLLLKGMGPLEIANALAISASTASTFKSRIFTKLGVSNVIDLNYLARLHGIQ